jgi:PAS domain S-box-containing protein
MPRRRHNSTTGIGGLVDEYVTVQLVLALVYVAAGRLGLSLAFVNASATAVWPPAGIALAAALILGPRRAWPGILAGAFIVNYITALSWPAALMVATGNTMEALLGAYLVNRFAGGRAGFSRTENLVLFGLLAGLLSTAVNATIGTTTLYLTGNATSSTYASIWTTWWLGDAAGVLLVAPAVLLWQAAPRPQRSRQQRLEILALGVITVLVPWIVFVRLAYPLPFLCLLVCVWAGLRFGQREAATAACVLSAIAVWGTVRGHGPLAAVGVNTDLLILQAFMAATAIVGLVVGGAVWESHRMELESQRVNEGLEQHIKARTAELQAAYDQMKEAQHVARVGSWQWTAADKSVWWSDEMYRICGAEPHSFNPSILGFLHPDDKDRVLATVQRALEDHRPFDLENRITRLDGELRVFHSQGRVVLDESNHVVRMVGTVQDITERKGLETQLRAAQQMEAVGRLAGGIAHDFNNLITAISGFTELVQSTLDETDPRHEDLLEVQKAASRAASLTAQLLAFGRRQFLQPKVLDLNALVGDIEKLLRRTIGEDIDLVLSVDPGLEAVRADPGQLEQVVVNIAVNARDAMPKGGQLRFVTDMVDVDEAAAQARAPMAPGRYVRLVITDTGTGMSPEIQQHIFEPFFTTKALTKGTGLGLATVYGIVQQSGGYVRVSSQPGLGTSFEICLPAVKEAVEASAPAKEPTAVTGGTETVLLAEDDDAVRRLACVALREHGYTVLEARNGEDALRVARSDRQRGIHLLITDVVMPGLSGGELALQLADERPDMRVLYTSGYAEDITMRAGLTRGAPLLAKPFLSRDLLRSVRETLDSDKIVGLTKIPDRTVGL